MTINQETLTKHSFLSDTVIWIGSLLFFIANVLFVIQGWYTRYWADDYCFSGLIKSLGFFNGLTAFYSSTSNRFSAFIFVGLSELFGRNAIRVIPLLVIITTVLLIFWIVNQLFGKQFVEGTKKTSFLYLQMLIFFILYLSPNMDQSVYWRSGLTHYLLPIPLLLFLLITILFPERNMHTSIVKLLLVFLLACFNAGLSESSAALQFGMVSLILLIKLVQTKLKIKKVELINILLILSGTVSAMAIMVLSPGNVLRLEALRQAPDVFSIVSISMASAFDFIKYTIRGFWFPYGVLFGLSILIAYSFINCLRNKKNKISFSLGIFLIPLLVFALIVCVCAPTAYGMMAYPEKRVLMLAHVVLVIGMSFEGILIGLLIKKYIHSSQTAISFGQVVVLLLCLYPLSVFPERLTAINIYKNRAEIWDARQSDIFSQIELGKTDLVVNAIDSFAEIAELNQDEKFWVNQCAANFYSVNSIIAVEGK